MSSLAKRSLQFRPRSLQRFVRFRLAVAPLSFSVRIAEPNTHFSARSADMLTLSSGNENADMLGLIRWITTRETLCIPNYWFVGSEVRADATLHFAIVPGPSWMGYYCFFFLFSTWPWPRPVIGSLWTRYLAFGYRIFILNFLRPQGTHPVFSISVLCRVGDHVRLQMVSVDQLHGCTDFLPRLTLTCVRSLSF
jgi:hypothetical protein